MDAFENLKNSQSNFDKLTKQIEANLNPEEATKSKDKYKDDRLWKPDLDKTGNGYAVIRFLPATQNEEMRGQEFGLTPFKVQVVGILKTL